MKHYDWLASESAHPDFPMEIVDGTFFYPGEEKGLYIPSGKIIHHGWGDSISVHVVGPDKKPLPDRMEITYYSYVEQAFYQGTFDLPHGEIEELFSSPYQTKSDRPVTLRELVVGVAPGGQVALWAQGVDRSVEVFFGTADPVDIEWSRIIDNPSLSKEEFSQKVVDRRVPDTKKNDFSENGIPFSKFERFRSKYYWDVRFFRMPAPDKKMRVSYVNGEKWYLSYDMEREDNKKPIPKFLSFHSDGHLFMIHFDDDEMLEVFEKMADKESPIYLDIAPGLPRHETAVRVRNEDDEHIDLEKITVEEIN